MLDASEPRDKSQLASYLGMINFYHRCIPNLSTELACLFKLNGKNEPWIWNEVHKNTFHRSKKLILNINSLVHYDPLLNLP